MAPVLAVGRAGYFYPRSPCGERLCSLCSKIKKNIISIHALLAESDVAPVLAVGRAGYFYPRSPCGERRKSNKLAGLELVFLSTLSLRRATSQQPAGTTRTAYFYPRSPCGERPVFPCFTIIDVKISIHALLAESDSQLKPPIKSHGKFLSTLSLRRATRQFPCQSPEKSGFLSTLSLRRATLNLPSSPIDKNISIHALLAESDNKNLFPKRSNIIFLSTLSLRRATLAGPSGPAFLYNFYPRSPCGERPEGPAKLPKQIRISIHALLAESDTALLIQPIRRPDFYPRSPCGERPPRSRDHSMGRDISIHALLAESDNKKNDHLPPTRNFYPRSPCGERPPSVFLHCTTYLFLSTLSLRRATPARQKPT